MGTEPNAAHTEVELEHPVLRDPQGAEGQETVPLIESSSSSPDKAAEDSRAYQDHLCWVAQNLGIQVEEISEGVVDPMTDVLSPSDPASVALPLIKTIDKNTEVLWQTHASISLTTMKVNWKYFVPSKNYE